MAWLSRFGLCLSVVLLAACASAPPITSSAGYYGANPNAPVKGSNAQAVESFVVDHDLSDARAAVIQAAGFEGLTTDVRGDKMISGTGQWTPPRLAGVCSQNQLFAAYFDRMDKRQTRITFRVDVMNSCAKWATWHWTLLRTLVANTNKVLATF